MNDGSKSTFFDVLVNGLSSWKVVARLATILAIVWLFVVVLPIALAGSLRLSWEILPDQIRERLLVFIHPVDSRPITPVPKEEKPDLPVQTNTLRKASKKQGVKVLQKPITKPSISFEKITGFGGAGGAGGAGGSAGSIGIAGEGGAAGPGGHGVMIDRAEIAP